MPFGGRAAWRSLSCSLGSVAIRGRPVLLARIHHVAILKSTVFLVYQQCDIPCQLMPHTDPCARAIIQWVIGTWARTWWGEVPVHGGVQLGRSYLTITHQLDTCPDFLSLAATRGNSRPNRFAASTNLGLFLVMFHEIILNYTHHRKCEMKVELCGGQFLKF